MITIKEIIFKTIKDFAETPYKINCGQCDQFAEKVVNVMQQNNYSFKDENAWPVCATEDFPCMNIYCGHVWIKYNNKHYDAEAPNGVMFPSELPIFARQSFYKSQEF